MKEIVLPFQPDYFSNHQIVDVFCYYDGPKIYSFLTESRDFYLAYYVDDNGSSEEWIFAPTSEATLDRLIRNELAIRTFFELCDICYLAKMNRRKAVEVKKKFFQDLVEEYLPENDVYLNYSDTMFSIRLIKNKISPRNTSEGVIGTVVASFRKLFKDTMRVLKETSSDFNDFPSNPDFACGGILVGSVNVILKPIQKNPLLEKAAQTIQQIAIGQNEGIPTQAVEKIERSMIQLAPKENSKLYDFDSIEFSGIIADGNQPKHLAFSLTHQKRSELEEKYGPTMLSRSVTLIGTVDSGTTSKEEFYLCHLEDNDIQLKDVKCRFDSEDVDLRGDIEEPAVWALMKASSSGKKLRISGDYDLRDNLITVQSIQTQ